MAYQLFSKIQDDLISRIEHSETSLKIAVTWLTNHDLFNAVLKKMEDTAFKVALIVLNDRINNKKEGVDFQKLINNKGSFYYSSVENMVHHKFCIIDDKVVITGSYNWTYYAESRNWENIVIIDNLEIVQAYIKEFNKITKCHERIKNIAEKRRFDTELSYSEYILNDSMYQAKREERKGNPVAALKIYNELLQVNREQPIVQKAKEEVIAKIVRKKLTVCPFEIGILFTSGYTPMIAALTPLPIITKNRFGCPALDNQTSVRIIVQKYEFTYKTILEFDLQNLIPMPHGHLCIFHTIKIDIYGLLTFICECALPFLDSDGEVAFSNAGMDGYNTKQIETVDLKKIL